MISVCALLRMVGYNYNYIERERVKIQGCFVVLIIFQLQSYNYTIMMIKRDP